MHALGHLSDALGHSSDALGHPSDALLEYAMGMPICILDDELKIFLQFLLTNDKSKPPNHKKLICFTLVCLWNVQIQILNQPKRPS